MVRTYRIRHYLGPTYNEAGQHVGQWSEVKFTTLAEAKKYQKLHGGTLYRPRVYERPHKRKRTRTSSAVDQPVADVEAVQQLDPAVAAGL